MDSASVLNTNGLPFVFDQMTYQGQLVGTLDSVVDTLFSGGVIAPFPKPYAASCPC